MRLLRRYSAYLAVLAVFCVWGDTRPSSTTGSTPAAFRAMVTRLAGVAYSDDVTVGDYVYPTTSDSAATLTAKYKTFTDACRPLAGHRILYTPGNHELIDSSARLHDAYVSALGPHDAYLAYAKTWKGAAICYVHLPTEGYGHEGRIGYYGEDDSRNSSEAKWLVAALRANTAPAVFVFMHHPMADPKTTDPWATGYKAEFAALDGLFAKYGVDAVFAGHVHNYRRHVAASGVTYVTQGLGGAPAYADGTVPIDAYDVAHFGSPWEASYTRVSVGRTRAYCETWRWQSGGTWQLFDNFVIEVL